MKLALVNFVVSALASSIISVIYWRYLDYKLKNKLSILEKTVEENVARISNIRSWISCLDDIDGLLRLSEHGEKVLEESGGKKFIDENKNTLQEIIMKANPQTSLHILDLSRQVIELQKDNEKFIPIKNYVYQKGLNLDDVLLALTLYLRDSVSDDRV